MHAAEDGVQAPISSGARHNKDKAVWQEQVLLQGGLLSSSCTGSALALAGLMCCLMQCTDLCMS